MDDVVLFQDDRVLKGPGLFSANLNVLFSITSLFGLEIRNVRVDLIDQFSSEGSDSYLRIVSCGESTIINKCSCTYYSLNYFKLVNKGVIRSSVVMSKSTVIKVETFQSSFSFLTYKLAFMQSVDAIKQSSKFGIELLHEKNKYINTKLDIKYFKLLMNRIKLNSLQQKVIPVIRDGLNTIISTPSGTGKTLCYSIPIIEQKRSIVLTPTKELSIQTYKTIRELDPNIRVTRIGSIGLIAPVVEMISDLEAKKLQNYGKERLQRMNDSLRAQLNWDLIDICISTPGQLAQLVKQGCPIQEVNCLVIDEADLTWGYVVDVNHSDVSFRESIYTIQRYLNINQFVLCNSVNTIKEEKEMKSVDGSKFTFYISKDFMQIPKRKIEFMDKPLQEYLDNQKTIIFVDGEKESQEVQKIVGPSKCFNSGQSVEERIRNVEEFRTNEWKTLICTGLGSRGLDFPDVTQIIMYDLPRNYEAFLLQCGRLRQENGRIIVKLKDSFDSAIYSEYERYKYVFPNSCVKL